MSLNILLQPLIAGLFLIIGQVIILKLFVGFQKSDREERLRLLIGMLLGEALFVASGQLSSLLFYFLGP
jgi:hypothetical protein